MIAKTLGTCGMFLHVFAFCFCFLHILVLLVSQKKSHVLFIEKQRKVVFLSFGVRFNEAPRFVIGPFTT